MIETHHITSRDQWLSLRKNDITASTVGALFGIHPYTTPLHLALLKTGRMEEDDKPNDAIERGIILEPAVALAVSRRIEGAILTKANVYLRDTDARLGATPDYFINIKGDLRGKGIVQIKTAAPWVFDEQWTAESPPAWIVLQALTEMMLTDSSWGLVAVLVVSAYGVDLHTYEIPRHPDAEQKIRERVATFWQELDGGSDPEPNFTYDGKAIEALFPTASRDLPLDLSGHNDVPVLLAEWKNLGTTLKEATKRKKEIENQIKFTLGDHAKANLPGWSISFFNVNRSAYKVEATTYRNLRITPHKERQQ